MPGPIASYSSRARASSTRCMVPLTRPWRWMNSSVSWLSTSTSALPMPMTSISPCTSAWRPPSRSATPAPFLPRRGVVLVEQQRQPLAGARRERGGIGDDGRAQRTRAPGRAELADARNHPADDDPGGGDGRPEVRHDGLDAHRVVLLVPDVVVGREGERRVAELGLAGELRFGHVGHPDHRHAPSPVDVRLRARRELRALDADVGAAVVHARAALAGGRLERSRQIAADGIGHADMADDAVAEEGGYAPARVVVELIRDHDVERMDVLLHAAHRADGDDRAGAERLEAIDVRPVVDVRGQEPMAPAVAGEEDHGGLPDAPDAVGVRRIAEWSLDLDPTNVLQAVHLVEATASHDTHRRTPVPAARRLALHASISSRTANVRVVPAAVILTPAKCRARSAGPSKSTST